MLSAWIHPISASSKELKIASLVAISTIIALVVAFVWSIFMPDDTTTTTLAPSYAVVVTPPHSSTLKPIETQSGETPRKSASQQAPESSHATITSPELSPTKAKPALAKQAANQQKIILGQGLYYVQVGAFAQPKLARLMLEKMKRKYKHAVATPKADQYMIWIGPVVSRNDAETLKKYILRHDNIAGFIIKSAN